MPKTLLISIFTLFVGLVTGCGITIWLYERPNENEVVQVMREVPVVQQVEVPGPTKVGPRADPSLGGTSIPPISSTVPLLVRPQAVPTPETPNPIQKVWVPKPGDRCHLIIPEYTALSGKDYNMYVLPLDTLALRRFIKYVTAFDGEGRIDLLHQRRAVWTTDPKVKVSIIAVNSRDETVEVRVRSEVYKAKFSYGSVTKSSCETPASVEAVVPLSWLVKDE